MQLPQRIEERERTLHVPSKGLDETPSPGKATTDVTLIQGLTPLRQGVPDRLADLLEQSSTGPLEGGTNFPRRVARPKKAVLNLGLGYPAVLTDGRDESVSAKG